MLVVIRGAGDIATGIALRLYRAGIRLVLTDCRSQRRSAARYAFRKRRKEQFFQKRIKGRGYCDVGTSVISEFYTPLVPKGHDFLQTIGSLALARQAYQKKQKEIE